MKQAGEPHTTAQLAALDRTEIDGVPAFLRRESKSKPVKVEAGDFDPYAWLDDIQAEVAGCEDLVAIQNIQAAKMRPHRKQVPPAIWLMAETAALERGGQIQRMMMAAE